MSNEAHRAILDRVKVESDVKEHFPQALTLLAGVVDYGTHLIVRVFNSSERKIVDLIVIGVLLKQIVLLADAIQLLVSKGAIQAAFLDARVALEASLSIDWILKDDSETKAKHFYVANLRRERLWALRLVDDTPERKAFSHVIDFMKIQDGELRSIQPTTREEIDRINDFRVNQNGRALTSSLKEEKGKGKHEVFW